MEKLTIKEAKMKKLKGIVLAGGSGSRLETLTKSINKHCLPVGNVPMIYWPIMRLKEIGITDIMIVTGTEKGATLFHQLGTDSTLGCNFTFKIQKEPNGIAGALALCEDFVGEDNCVVILGDNIFDFDLSNYAMLFNGNEFSGDVAASFVLTRSENPERFGVATIDNLERHIKKLGDMNEMLKNIGYVSLSQNDYKAEYIITDITEKPTDPKSNWIVTGIYMYDCSVFNVIRTLQPSKRNELEISDVNMHYVKTGKAQFFLTEDFWSDAGTIPSYEEANVFAWEHKQNHIQDSLSQVENNIEALTALKTPIVLDVILDEKEEALLGTTGKFRPEFFPKPHCFSWSRKVPKDFLGTQDDWYDTLVNLIKLIKAKGGEHLSLHGNNSDVIDFIKTISPDLDITDLGYFHNKPVLTFLYDYGREFAKIYLSDYYCIN